MKFLRTILSILKWPAIMLSLPILSLWLPYVFSGEDSFYAATTVDSVFYVMFLGFLLSTIIAGFIGALISKTFLVSTGIGALIYTIASFFIRSEADWQDQFVNFTNFKFIFVFIMVCLLFIGDVFGLIFRKVKYIIEEKEK